MSIEDRQPRTRVTLRVAEEGDKIIYVNETTSYVRAAAEAGGYVMMTRMRGWRFAEFTTQASNIMNIEDVSE